MPAYPSAIDFDELKRWVGRTESRSDHVAATPVAALAATLDRDEPFPRPGDTLPPLWHWLFFPSIHRHSETGPDGHPKRGGFLPPVRLPRRMFAGGRFEFLRPLRIGDAMLRLSRIVDVRHKEGRTGPLVFVIVRHEIGNAQGVAVTEEHDIVYRDNPRPDDLAPPPRATSADCTWSRDIRPDPVLLFRYSALTLNNHRIHYDRQYVTGVEGYPGLVVHGPLLATLLMDLLRCNLPEAQVQGLTFRAVRPLFDTAPFQVCGTLEHDRKSARLWAKDADGLAMEATAALA